MLKKYEEKDPGLIGIANQPNKTHESSYLGNNTKHIPKRAH